jgi:uncharacterized phage-associated protein
METVYAVDVAEYLLQRAGPMSAFKLQKLVYYCDAWHMVHAGGPLVREDFEAWVNGPVVPALFQQHKGRYTVTTVRGDARRVAAGSRGIVDEVLRAYGRFTPGDLIDMTHAEEPWIRARQGLGPLEPASRTIDKSLMREYYSSVLDDPDAEDL